MVRFLPMRPRFMARPFLVVDKRRILRVIFIQRILKALMYISTVHIFFIPMIRRSGSILHSLQSLTVLPTAR